MEQSPRQLKFTERFIENVLISLFLISISASSVRADYTWEGVPTGEGLAWSDEFNGTVGSAPNTSNWRYDTGATGWGNSELENYTTSTQNSQILSDSNALDGKALGIITIDTTPGSSSYNTVGRYTSARLVSSLGTSFPGQSFQYGYMEARVKMPYGDGIWPAFWMLGDSINSGTAWPGCGEIDIMENIGSTSDQPENHGSLHDGTDFTALFGLPGGQLYHNAYHTFGAAWQLNQIQFYVDGNLYETVNSTQQGGTWEFNNAFFFLLNSAVGGSFPGSPDASTSFPQTMYVDYVRAYQSGQPTPTPVVQATWRVRCGGDNYTDSQSNLWVADTNFTGGWPSATTNAITGSLPVSSDQTLYQYERYGNTTGGQTLTYTFNVPTGSQYNVTLKFAEDYWTASGKRLFSYAINGVTEASNFDIYADSGGQYKADDKVYNNISPNGSGQIVIQLIPGSADNPKIDAIQIVQVSGTPTFTPTITYTPTVTYTPTITDTPTITFTPTITYTPTVTVTNTATSTPTNTFTPTNTPTITFTPTITSTPSFTPTFVNPGKPLIYPNPVSGDTASVRLPLTAPSNVSIKIFTVAFRMVRSIQISQVPVGVDQVISITDKDNISLADGLYYFVIDAQGNHWTSKVLVIR